MPQPPFSVQTSEGIAVLRDDLIEGGTKRRGLERLLHSIHSERIFYAGTAMGHGALALAHACRAHGKEAHIYISMEESHPHFLKLHKAGAKVHIQPPMPIVAIHDIARRDAQAQDTILPPGFATPDFEEALCQALLDFNAEPYTEIWTVCVTGTLSQALKRAFGSQKVKTVSTVKSVGGDFAAPEKYHQKAKLPPPYPSCPHTDAKIWRFRSLAAEGTLIWNTAG